MISLTRMLYKALLLPVNTIPMVAACKVRMCMTACQTSTKPAACK